MPWQFRLLASSGRRSDQNQGVPWVAALHVCIWMESDEELRIGNVKKETGGCKQKRRCVSKIQRAEVQCQGLAAETR